MNTNASYASVGSQQSYPQSTHTSPVPNGSSGYNGNPPVPATPRYPDTRTDTSEDTHSSDRQGHVPKKALSRYFQASTGAALSAAKRCQSNAAPQVLFCCAMSKLLTGPVLLQASGPPSSALVTLLVACCRACATRTRMGRL